jgi:ubiquinone/menaquinone biosynthesis C-methylase UbiE
MVMERRAQGGVAMKHEDQSAASPNELSARTASFFSSFASKYHSSYGRITPGGYGLRIRHQRVLELLEGIRGSVIDVGCGPGELVRALAEKKLSVSGVDAAEGMIEQASQLTQGMENVRLAVGDATRLEEPDGAFDVVTCIGVIERIAPNSAAFSEMARVVKTGGTVVISFPNSFSPYVTWKKLVFYPAVAALKRLLARAGLGHFRPLVLAPVGNYYTSKRVRRQLERHGLRVIQITYCNFNICLSPIDEWFPGLAVRLAGWLEKLHTGMFRWLGCVMVVKAVKTS